MSAWHRGLVGSLLLLAIVQVSGINDGLNRWLTDTHWRWRAAWKPTPFPNDIVVVGIDDKTVQRFGRLRYWSRARYAELLERLRLAKAVGIDVLFTEADESDSQGDAALAKAMRDHGKVVIPVYEWKEARPFSGETQMQEQALLQRLPRSSTSFAGQLPPVSPHALQPPIMPLLDAASAVGNADINADADGVNRTPVLLRVTGNNNVLPHWSVSIACVARGVPLADAVREAPSRVRLGSRVVPLFGGTLWLQPIARRGGGYAAGLGQPVPTVSFVDALTMPPEKFAGKVMLVGETATGTSDVRPNPLDNSLRGVELTAEILANLLHLPKVQPLPLSVQWLLILLAIGVPFYLYSVLSPRGAAVGAGLTLLAVMGVMEAVFWAGRLVPSWSPVLAGFLGSTLLMGLQRLAEEEAKKRQIRQSFSLYVPPEVVEEIVQDPEITHQEGTRQRVAILFSDVRSFTSYSEQNPPELVVRQMREYLTEMTEAVYNHQGMLDKFIGDAVMALWGPFLDGDANVSSLSVACALEMLERLERLNERWAQEGMPSFRIGIGIHVGDAIVGNIGSPLRMQYTALGDTVNLSSRLQTATKELYATLVVSDGIKVEAEPLLGGVAEFVPRGALAVRGREQAVEVYEVRRRGSMKEVTSDVGSESPEADKKEE